MTPSRRRWGLVRYAPPFARVRLKRFPDRVYLVLPGGRTGNHRWVIAPGDKPSSLAWGLTSLHAQSLVKVV